MEQYVVTGMSCAACQARVEKAVSKVPGVTSCSVSLLTNSMGVEGTAKPGDIVAAVEAAGYGAKPKDAAAQTESASAKLAAEEDALKDRTTPLLKKRLIKSIVILLALMYISMGHNMWNWPLPSFFEGNYMALAITQMILAFWVMSINKKFFTSGFNSLIHGAPNMDTLVALGSSVSFGWSLYVLYRLTGAEDPEIAMHMYHNQLYFESAAMIPALITVGKMLEAMSKGRTTDALKSLMKLAPQKATLLRNGQEVEVGIDEVRIGDTFVVRPGESIPVDGVIIEGSTAVNESALTGESIPVDKSVDDTVSAATINTSGYIKARATRVGEDTTLSQIIHMVSDAAATKAPIARIADKVSGIFVPTVMIIALFVMIVWLIRGVGVSIALERAIAVLVISCPCALGLATPVAIMVGNGMGAKNGILFKTSEALENAGRTQIVALDKTGTITTGKPAVTDILPSEGVDEKELLTSAYAMEKKSEHPLAQAVIEKAEAEGLTCDDASDFKALSGHGLEAVISGKKAHAGNAKFISTLCTIPSDLKEKSEALSEEGKTPLFFEEEGKLLGVIAVADVIKEDSRQAVQELQNMGIEVVMITGDNEKTAKAIGAKAGVDHVIAGVLPDGKEAEIRRLQKRGKVAMVGDGINDAPALTRADTGIAIGAGTDVAIDSADVVLMNSRLTDVSAAVRLSRAALINIHENLFWAFFYNLICIPLAAGVYGYMMNPMIGAAAMSLSSFTVCMNALRLNLFKLHDASKDRPMKHPALPESEEEKKEETAQTEESTMKETVKISGMMCEHCENRIQKAIGALDGVTSVKADHTSGTAVIEMSHPVAESRIKEAVEGQDYEYVGIEENKEDTDMEKTLDVEGMMCEHCEARVKKALEAVDGVESASADHNAGKAVVVLTEDVDDAVLKKAVEDQDYKVTGIHA